MCRELRRTFLPVGITVEREISTVRKIFRLGQNSSKSPASQTPGTRKNVNFENRRYGFSSYNSMSAELLLVFLPVGITVEREILTVRTIFRFGQNSSKSPASQTPGTRKNVNFENRRYGFSSYNCMSVELLLVFLPVGITVEREILTVRTIFRFGQNSSKSQPARLLAHEKT